MALITPGMVAASGRPGGIRQGMQRYDNGKKYTKHMPLFSSDYLSMQTHQITVGFYVAPAGGNDRGALRLRFSAHNIMRAAADQMHAELHLLGLDGVFSHTFATSSVAPTTIPAGDPYWPPGLFPELYPEGK